MCVHLIWRPGPEEQRGAAPAFPPPAPSLPHRSSLRYLTLTNCELLVLPPVVRGMAGLRLLKLNINRLQARLAAAVPAVGQPAAAPGFKPAAGKRLPSTTKFPEHRWQYRPPPSNLPHCPMLFVTPPRLLTWSQVLGPDCIPNSIPLAALQTLSGGPYLQELECLVS